MTLIIQQVPPPGPFAPEQLTDVSCRPGNLMEQFHRLWTQAAQRKDYDKPAWVRLEAMLCALQTLALTHGRDAVPSGARREPELPWAPPAEGLTLKDATGDALEVKRTYDGGGLRLDLGPGDIELTPAQAYELCLFLKSCFGEG